MRSTLSCRARIIGKEDGATAPEREVITPIRALVCFAAEAAQDGPTARKKPSTAKRNTPNRLQRAEKGDLKQGGIGSFAGPVDLAEGLVFTTGCFPPRSLGNQVVRCLFLTWRNQDDHLEVILPDL
jgi:hypothetical protein